MIENRQKSSARIVVIAAAIVIVVAGAGWLAWVKLRGPGPGTATSQPARTITIAGARNISFLPIVAGKMGYFDSPGSATPIAKYSPLNTGKLAMDALMAGDLDVAVVVDPNITQLLTGGQAPFVVVAGIMQKTDDAVAARVDRGVRVPADLRGKTIAYIPGTSSEAFLWRLLEKNNIRMDEVKLISSSPPAMQPAITGADGVGAICIWQPWRANSLGALGSNGVEFPNDGLYRGQVLLVVRRDRLPQLKDSLPNVIRALIRAQQYIAAEPAKSQEMLAKEMGMDLSALKATWSQYSPVVELRNPLLENIRAEWRHSQALHPDAAKSEPDCKSLIDPTLLRAIDPASVDQAFQ